MGADVLLDIQALSIASCTNGKLLVDALTLQVGQGKTVALVGTSGAGKSLTSLAVLGLLPESVCQTSGEILFCGQSMGILDKEQRRQLRNGQIAMIMQNPLSAFDPVFTVRSHFVETMRAHQVNISKREIEERACKALYEVGFPDAKAILDVYPFQLSGGMLQRVMIALALINAPQLLIADEATTDLDVVSQAHIIRLLCERKKHSGLSVLLITHDLSVAAFFADDVVVVDQGRVVEAGTVEQVFYRPQAAFTQQLLEAHHDLYRGVFEPLWSHMTKLQGIAL